jgi:hypothetical protein
MKPLKMLFPQALWCFFPLQPEHLPQHPIIGPPPLNPNSFLYMRDKILNPYNKISKVCFVFLALQPIVVVFSQPGSGL